MQMIAVVSAGIGALVTAGVTAALLPLMRRAGFVDAPFTTGRKIHARPMVLVGGVAIVITFSAILFLVSHVAPELIPSLTGAQWHALIAATCAIFIVGLLDDKFGLPPVVQLVGPIIATVLVVAAGIEIKSVTHPLGGVITFGSYEWFTHVLTGLWLMAMMYGTKLLDGLDGLATGLSTIGALMIFALTETAAFYEPRLGFVALVFAGCCLGFLKCNFHPARAFLGEGGSLFLGFVLGVLAILSGSKIATTLLVMGLPVFDVVRLIVVRIARGQTPFAADQGHMHHLLLRNGVSHTTAVITFYFFGTVFGISALLLPTIGKIIMLIVLLVGSWCFATFLERRVWKK